MKRKSAVIAALAAAVIGIGGGAAAALLNDDDNVDVDMATPSPSPAAATPSPSPSPSPSTPAVDGLSEENLVRERMYFDVTGHSFTQAKLGADAPLGPCTGESTFADALPVQGVTRLGTKLTGPDGAYVVEQVAQTGSAGEARTAAEEIVSLVDDCAAIQGGDFGYGDPVTVVSESDRNVVYFPAFDTDRVYGGYVVFSVGTRVGVIDVSDTATAAQVAALAKEAAEIAAD